MKPWGVSWTLGVCGGGHKMVKMIRFGGRKEDENRGLLLGGDDDDAL